MTMTQTLDDFFGGNPDDERPLRDRHSRPLLIPTAEYPGLTADQRVLAAQGLFRVPYTRASSMANYIANFMALHTWQQRRLAKGLGSREDLCAMAASLPLFKNDSKADALTNARLDEIIELAMEIGQVHEQANYGTAIHQFTEPERNTGPVPERMRADVQSFWDATSRSGMRILDTEVFTAYDRNKVAGTVDHLMWVPGYGKILADKKTGDLKPLEFAVQFSSYRDGDRYDPYTDERTPWGDDVNADFALIIDIPAGKGKTVIHELDLNYGREMAALAARVRDGHTLSPTKVRKDIGEEIEQAWQRKQADLQSLILGLTERDQMLALREQHLDWWTADLDAICKQTLEGSA